MTEFTLTRKEREALTVLAKKHDRSPSNTYGFLPSTIGASNAAACRRMESTGLVVIKRVDQNCFRYALSETGKKHVKGGAA